MIELGFKYLKSNTRIFLYWKKGTFIVVMIVYINDVLFCSPNKKLVDEVKSAFMKKWECQNLSVLKEFFWISVISGLDGNRHRLRRIESSS